MQITSIRKSTLRISDLKDTLKIYYKDHFLLRKNYKIKPCPSIFASVNLSIFYGLNCVLPILHKTIFRDRFFKRGNYG